ncbi:hypothetical protein PR048_003274 [Dryococelus australis]|uniref:Uncharacterized protein n=1 Tax=Dryococelus australis TaxID=614101 RepID=A0ABQ9IMM8_9NEOP|nr:hypothetical protein PR048_003274 [Dryococelus australis]
MKMKPIEPNVSFTYLVNIDSNMIITEEQSVEDIVSSQVMESQDQKDETREEEEKWRQAHGRWPLPARYLVAIDRQLPSLRSRTELQQQTAKSAPGHAAETLVATQLQQRRTINELVTPKTRIARHGTRHRASFAAGVLESTVHCIMEDHTEVKENYGGNALLTLQQKFSVNSGELASLEQGQCIACSGEVALREDYSTLTGIKVSAARIKGYQQPVKSGAQVYEPMSASGYGRNIGTDDTMDCSTQPLNRSLLSPSFHLHHGVVVYLNEFFAEDKRYSPTHFFLHCTWNARIVLGKEYTVNQRTIFNFTTVINSVAPAGMEYRRNPVPLHPPNGILSRRKPELPRVYAHSHPPLCSKHSDVAAGHLLSSPNIPATPARFAFHTVPASSRANTLRLENLLTWPLLLLVPAELVPSPWAKVVVLCLVVLVRASGGLLVLLG